MMLTGVWVKTIIGLREDKKFKWTKLKVTMRK